MADIIQFPVNTDELDKQIELLIETYGRSAVTAAFCRVFESIAQATAPELDTDEE